MIDTHALKRTSPKGGPFIGRCTKCGAIGLRMGDALKPCPNPSGVTQHDALIRAIDGDAKEPRHDP